MLLSTVYPHTIFQYCHVKKHLYPIVLFWFQFPLHGIFICLPRLHFYETAHVALHIVQSSLNAQCLTNIRGFQYGIRFIQIVSRFQEGIINRLTNMFKMHLTIFKESCFFFFIQQFLTSRQFNGIPFEYFLHAIKIFRFLLACIYPFIQKKIGYITQQKRTSIIYRHQPTHDVIGRMTSIIPITFRQCTNVHQIVWLKNNKRRRISSVVIPFHIQKVQLSMTPILLYSFREFIIYS